jgi:kynurenine formamidase
MARGPRFLDVGVALAPGIATYPGNPEFAFEPFRKPGAPAHRAVLSQGVVVIEGLNLSNAEPGLYEIYCLPLRIAGAGGAPARVVLKR